MIPKPLSEAFSAFSGERADQPESPMLRLYRLRCEAEVMIEEMIELLDAIDAPTEDMEPYLAGFSGNGDDREGDDEEKEGDGNADAEDGGDEEPSLAGLNCTSFRMTPVSNINETTQRFKYPYAERRSDEGSQLHWSAGRSDDREENADDEPQLDPAETGYGDLEGMREQEGHYL